MAHHDYIIANQSGAAFRADLNNGLAAIVSQNSGAAQPSTTYAYQWWADTTTGLLKIRNAANSAWITVGTLASANLGLLSPAGGTLTGILLIDDAANTPAAPALAFDGDSNTGIYRPSADQLAIATGGTGRVFVDSSGNVGIGAAAIGTDRLYVQGGNARIFAGGAGTSLEVGTGATGNQFAIIDLVGDTTYPDYALRLIRDNTGANTTASLRHRGTGTFSIVAEDAAAIAIGTTNTPRVQVAADGSVSSVVPGGSTLLPQFGCRAWVNFNGASSAIRGSGNVSSVTRTATGEYTINFTTAMPDANYATTGLGHMIVGETTTGRFLAQYGDPLTTSTKVVACNGINATRYDPVYGNVAIFR